MALSPLSSEIPQNDSKGRKKVINYKFQEKGNGAKMNERGKVWRSQSMLADLSDQKKRNPQWGKAVREFIYSEP